MLRTSGHALLLAAILGIGTLSPLTTGKALAAPTQVFAGGEGGSEQAYLYAGVLRPWGDSSNWATRYWFDAQHYEYDSGGRAIVGKVIGFTPAIVRSFAFDGGYLALSAGLRFADTRLSPDDPGNKQRGFQTSVPLQVDGQRRLGGVVLSAIVSGEPDVGSYWSRARVARERTLGDLSLGVEVIAKGSDEYSATQVGLIVGGIAGDRVSLKFGSSRQDGRTPGTYLGIEVGVPIGQ